MRNEMSSRERLLLTIDHSEPDHVPFLFSTFPPPLAPASSFSEFQRVGYFLRLGLDAAIRIDPPMFFPHAVRPLGPDVRTMVWKEVLPGERFPVLHKEYETPGGTLRQTVRQTLDWPHGDDIPLFTDFCVPKSRSVKYLIEDQDDLDALQYLFPDPTEGERKAFVEEATSVRRFAEAHEALVLSGGFGFAPLFGGDAIAWLCGIENVLLAAYDRPDFLHRLLDIVFGWNAKYIQLLAEAGGADVIAHRAYYECTLFWSPKLYREIIAPLIRKEIELVHQAGAKFCYIMVEGFMPLLESFKDLGIDILLGPDPVERGMDLKRVKDEIGDRICLWGGVSEHVTLETLDRQRIEREVQEAIQTLAPGGGFILTPVDNRPAMLWESTTYMIEAWRAACSYPIAAVSSP